MGQAPAQVPQITQAASLIYNLRQAPLMAPKGNAPAQVRKPMHV